MIDFDAPPAIVQEAPQIAVTVPRIVGDFHADLPARTITPAEASGVIQRFIQGWDWGARAEADIKQRWAIGETVCALAEEGAASKRAVIHDLREGGVERSQSWLYECVGVYRYFDTPEDITTWRASRDRQGLPNSFSAMKEALLAPEREAERDGQPRLERVTDSLLEATELFQRAEKKLQEARAQGMQGEEMDTVEALWRDGGSDLHDALSTTPGAAAALDEPVRDEAHLAFVRTLTCLACHKGPVDPHHVLTGGMGTKADDDLTIPLCRKHHDYLHDHGLEAFEGAFDVDVWKAVLSIIRRRRMGRWVPGVVL